MIGFFPTPYPDELFYSICARYHHRAGYRSYNYTTRDLFGRCVVAAIDLPGNLNHLIAALPPGHCYSVDQLIDEHTLLRFYAPFLSPERGAKLHYNMAEKEHGSLTRSRVGFNFPFKARLEFLRYCPVCVTEDRREYGEAYWHRLHQAPRVIVCPHHEAWLEPSSLYVRHRGAHRRFLRAEQLVRDVPVRPLKPEECDHQTHLWIARETKWLLDHFPGANSPEQLCGRYHGLLFARGLASYGGVIWIGKLQEEFRTFYSEELLSELHCRLDLPWNWLMRLTNRSIWTHHPIHHLLLMRFLGCSVAEFFQLPTEPQPFGAGPWHCLNPVCEHYQEPRIEKFKIRCMAVGDQMKKAADFRCECGFTYSRPFPNNTTKSDTDHYRVMSCGPTWEETLRQLYHSGKYTKHEMAEKLGVKPSMIMNKVKQIRRDRQISDKHDLAKQTRSLARAEARRLADELKRTKYREKWLQAIKGCPTAGRSRLGEIEQTAYSWLLEHDREWFEANSPPPHRPPGPPPITDWKQRDSELASAARAVAERLRQATEPPIRVSKFVIAREIGGVLAVTTQAHHIPLTMAVLAAVTESLDEWAVRRIQLAAESFRQEGRRPTPEQILNRAVVERKAIRNKPILRTALVTVMREFEAPEGKPHNRS